MSAAPLDPTAVRSPAASKWYEPESPVTGQVLGRVRVWGAEEIVGLLEEDGEEPLNLRPTDVFAFLGRLRHALEGHRQALIEATLLETGFIEADCAEMVDGAIEFLRDFETHVRERRSSVRAIPHSYGSRSRREMRIARRAYHTVAALVPQNASLPLSITIVASALAAGSRLLLRPSLQCAASGALLADLVALCEPPATSIRIVNALAKEFLQASCDAPHVELIHYIGSNRYALEVFNQAFAARKPCLLDGQGNGLLYVDDGFPVEEAVRLIVAGATRYNGETCTSVNGVLTHPNRYRDVRDGVVEAMRALRVGHPASPETQVGPLLSRQQAEDLVLLLKAGPSRRVLCGGEADGAFFPPTVVEGVDLDAALLREGFFGPAAWVRAIDESALVTWLQANHFPLSDTILSERPDLILRFAARSRAARICVNQDPSIESMFEPWGGYPAGGLNPVSDWVEKYRQPYQLDGAPRELSALSDATSDGA